MDEVDLLETNPQYAHVKLAEGRETTVLIKQLSPAGISSNENTNIFNHIDHVQDVENVPLVTNDVITTQKVENEWEVQLKEPVKRHLKRKCSTAKKIRKTMFCTRQT